MADNSLFGGPDTSALTGAVSADKARADQFYRQLALLQQQYQQQLAAQGALTRSFDRTIAGTAPSVAGTQLQRGVSQIRDATSAQAAGASGNNAALANYGAIQALAQAQAKANADAAVLRAREVADAQAAKAGVLNNMQQATGAQTGQQTSAATGLQGVQTTGAAAEGKLNADELAAQRAFASNLVNGVGSLGVVKSDENEKTNKQPIPSGDMDAFLKHISGFTFDYKDKTNGEGTRTGPMAQDVAKGGPVGAAVSDGENIDIKNAIGALLAAVAHVNRKAEARP